MRHDPVRWKSDYQRDGVLVVEDVLDPQLLDQLRHGIAHITDDPDNVPEHLRSWVHMERDFVKTKPQYNELGSAAVGAAVRNIMELPRFDPMFADLICHPPVLDILEALFDSSEFHFHNYKCIVKAPHVGSRFCWHRDLPYLDHSTDNLITAMLCLDPMTEANGATVVLPGSHLDARAKRADMADTDIPEEKIPAKYPRVTVTCPAGSLVAFNVNVLHGGGPNRSDVPRRNVIGIWAGPNTYPITSARYSYQDVYPRSQDPARQKQMHMTFPHLYHNP